MLRTFLATVLALLALAAPATASNHPVERLREACLGVHPVLAHFAGNQNYREVVMNLNDMCTRMGKLPQGFVVQRPQVNRMYQLVSTALEKMHADYQATRSSHRAHTRSQPFVLSVSRASLQARTNTDTARIAISMAFTRAMMQPWPYAYNSDEFVYYSLEQLLQGLVTYHIYQWEHQASSSAAKH